MIKTLDKLLALENTESNKKDDNKTSRSLPDGHPMTHRFIFEINPLEKDINLKCAFDLYFLLK